MKKSILVFVFTIIAMVAYPQQFRVVGYMPNWVDMASFSAKYDFTRLTHVNIAFQNPDTNGNLIVNSVGMPTLVNKAHAANAKVLISLAGGAASENAAIRDRYFLLLKNKREQFAHKILEYLIQFNLDGVDVDLEGPAINGDYEAFIKVLHDTLHPKGYLLTAALKHDYGGNKVTNKTLTYFDFVNIMAYDETGSWSATAAQHSSFQYAQTSVSYWKNKGLTDDQCVLGLPFYGYGWNTDKGNFSYAQILSKYPGAQNADQAGNVIYYNGIKTIQDKTNYAWGNGYGGVMIWEITNDVANEFSLLKSIHDLVVTFDPNNKIPAVSILSPLHNQQVTGSAIEILVAASDTDGVVTKLELFNGDVKIAEIQNKDTLRYTWTSIDNGTFNLKAKATDNKGKIGESSIVSITAQVTKAPFGSTKIAIPGKIEVENFDKGGQGISYNDASVENQGGAAYRFSSVDIERCTDENGGYNIGYVFPNEWVEFSVTVAETKRYMFEFRLATQYSGRLLHVEVDGKNVTGAVSVPNTGGWQKWASVFVSDIDLVDGDHLLRLVFDSGDFNINYINTTIVSSTIQGMDLKQLVQLFPNPANATLTLTSPFKTSQITILNSLGLVLMSSNESSLNVSDLEPGVYFVTIQTEKGNLSTSFVKE